MKRILLSVACAAALTTGVALAQDEGSSTWSLAGTFGVTSDYMFRGQSQTNHDAALQGSLTVAHDSGFYLGVWGSNVDFGNDTDFETDFYVGYGGAISDSTTYDLNVTYYAYPNAPDGTEYDYFETVGTVTYTSGDFSIYGKTALSPEFFGKTGFAAWLGTGVGYQVIDGVKISGNVGYQWIDDNTLAGIPDYFNYDVGVTGTYGILSIDLRYFGTDLSDIECYGGTDLCSERFVGSATLNF
ncbi:hypothetical protein sos41_14220 [Alphaproteobacteria bacterium SO-S41]|nr:hypothetical protein sos41_14220 [Alphaproteobacteria bacterium SO-S41]